MGDRVGLIVMLAVVVLLVALLFVMRPRRRADTEHEHETLNPDVDAADTDEQQTLEGTGRERLVGNPPVDTVNRSGSGTAVPGTGAGGRTTDSHDALRRAPGDSADSPDQR